MSTHLLRAGLSAMLLLISTNLWAADPPNDTAKKTDDAQMKKQCADMKNMDMSKMSAAEHDAMMKKCKEMMQKDKKKPAASSNY
jgi:hypothetical protein